MITRCVSNGESTGWVSRYFVARAIFSPTRGVSNSHEVANFSSGCWGTHISNCRLLSMLRFNVFHKEN